MTARILDLPFRAWRRLTWAYRRRFQSDHQVFVRRSPFPAEIRPDVQFLRFEHFEEVPESVRQAIIANQDQRALEKDEREIRDHSLMWVAIVDDKVASACHSRKGKFFRTWFVPLNDDDIVLFRARTYPEFRGRGIIPSIYRHIMHQELPESARAFADCAEYNKASRRSLEKAGFQLVTVAKPITREWALHGRNPPRSR